MGGSYPFERLVSRNLYDWLWPAGAGGVGNEHFFPQYPHQTESGSSPEFKKTNELELLTLDAALLKAFHLAELKAGL